MNIRARDVLLIAFLKQQVEGSLRQLRNTELASDGQGGFCTIGLLLHTVGCEHLMLNRAQIAGKVLEDHDACQREVSETYEIDKPEWLAIIEDNLRFDWLTIALKHCPHIEGEVEEA